MMERNNDMGVFRENYQRLYGEACYAFSESQNLAHIGRLSGVKKLGDKLNPEQSLVNSMLRSLDMVGAHVEFDTSNETLLKRTLTNGELPALTFENSGEIRLPRRKAQQIIDTCNASIANLFLLANGVENRTSGYAPFLSMTTGFIVQNGVSGLV